jgi:hypothetical protein
MPHQHEVQALVTGRLLEREDIGRGLDHAQLAAVAPPAGAQGAQLLLAQRAAIPAMTDAFHGLLQHRREPAAAVAVALQQVIGHALRGFRTHARQRA